MCCVELFLDTVIKLVLYENDSCVCSQDWEHCRTLNRVCRDSHHFGNEGGISMATIGCMREFVPETGLISVYMERLQLYFKAYRIAADKLVAVLPTVVSSEHYDLIRGLIALHFPKHKSVEELFELLKSHFEPKPLIITEQFHFTAGAKHRMNLLSSMWWIFQSLPAVVSLEPSWRTLFETRWCVD